MNQEQIDRAFENAIQDSTDTESTYDWWTCPKCEDCLHAVEVNSQWYEKENSGQWYEVEKRPQYDGVDCGCCDEDE